LDDNVKSLLDCYYRYAQWVSTYWISLLNGERADFNSIKINSTQNDFE